MRLATKAFVLAGSAVLSYVVFSNLKDQYFALMIVGTLFLHEFGHWAVLRAFGMKGWIVFVPPIGALVFPDKPQDLIFKLTRGEDIAVSLAGTFMNTLICLASLVGMRSPELADWHGELGRLADLNAQLIIFNLLLVSPLDGGRFARALIGTGKRLNRIFAVFSLLHILVLYQGGLLSVPLLIYMLGIQLIMGVAKLEDAREYKKLSILSAAASLMLYFMMIAAALYTVAVVHELLIL